MTRTKFWVLALAALIGLGAFSIPQSAEAGRGWYGPGWKAGYWGPRRGYWGPRRGYWGPGPAWGAGLVGLGVGLAVGSALAAPPVYAPPPPVYGYDGYGYDVPPPPPGAYGPDGYGAEGYGPESYGAEGYAPTGYAAGANGPGQGSQDWLTYCSSKYRSFNPQTGMYTGYDGVQRPCQ